MALASPAITVDQVERRRHRRGPDIGGALFRVALLATLVISLVFLLVLLGTVIWKGLGVFTTAVPFIPNRLRYRRPRSQLPHHRQRRGRRPGRGVAGGSGFSPGSRASSWSWRSRSGSGAAIYLEEYAPPNRLTRFINVNIRNLAGVPSIVYGILGLSIFVKSLDWFTGGRTVIAAGITLAVLVLPIVIITSAEAIRAVPDSIREAGFGVGATPVGGRPEPRAPLRRPRHPHRHRSLARPGARGGRAADPRRCHDRLLRQRGRPEPVRTSSRVRSPPCPIVIFGWAGRPSEGWPENTAAAILVCWWSS